VAGRIPGLALPDGKTIAISVTAGPSKGLELRLVKPLVSIGRAGSGADLEIDDPGVSRMHCAVEVTSDAIRLRDLESTNGTYVNEQRVLSAELEHLSEFRVGSSVLCVRVVSKHR
jgi:S-DNA-T family DNA segregation ATPase FtsK/SpoIIIE